MMQLEIDIVPISEANPDQIRPVHERFNREFGHYPFEYAGADWLCFGRQGKEIAATAELLRREIRVAGQVIPVIGVKGLITNPELRGKGLGSAMMHSFAEFTAQHCHFGMLHTSEQLSPFYAGLGWIVIANPVTCIQRGHPVPRKPVNLILRCTTQEWPEGEVDLCGLPW